MVVPDEPRRLGNVTIVTDYDRTVIGVQPAIVQEVHGEIDIRTFFLGLDYGCRALLPDGMCERHGYRMAQKMPEVYLHLRPMVAKGRRYTSCR